MLLLDKVKFPKKKAIRKYIKSNLAYRRVFLVSLVFVAMVAVGIVSLTSLYAGAFVGPVEPSGSGGGAIGVDSADNISVGSSTTRANTKMLIISSSTGSSAWAFGIYQPDGTTPILLVRDDKKVSIGASIGSATLTVAGDISATGNISGTYTGAVSSTNIRAGSFGASVGGGDYVFPANLAISTSSATYKLDVWGTGRFTNNLAIGTPISNGDAVPKNYVDALAYWVEGAGGYLYVASTTRSLAIGTSTAPSYRLDVSGSGRFTGSLIASGGINLNNQNITGVNKLTVTTIDPIYLINGRKYATYVSDTIGLKMEVYGKAKLSASTKYQAPSTKSKKCLEFGTCDLEFGGGDGYEYVIDFNKLAIGSDLWLFWQTIKEGRDMQDIVVSLTPEGAPARVWYKLLSSNRQLVFYSDREVTISYHLTAPRHDSDSWPNISESGESGVPLPIKR